MSLIQKQQECSTQSCTFLPSSSLSLFPAILLLCSTLTSRTSCCHFCCQQRRDICVLRTRFTGGKSKVRLFFSHLTKANPALDHMSPPPPKLNSDMAMAESAKPVPLLGTIPLRVSVMCVCVCVHVFGTSYVQVLLYSCFFSRCFSLVSAADIFQNSKTCFQCKPFRCAATDMSCSATAVRCTCNTCALRPHAFLMSPLGSAHQHNAPFACRLLGRWVCPRRARNRSY